MKFKKNFQRIPYRSGSTPWNNLDNPDVLSHFGHTTKRSRFVTNFPCSLTLQMLVQITAGEQVQGPGTEKREMSVGIVVNRYEEETVSDRLIISLACGIGIAAEEIDNIKVQILALAKQQGLLIHDGFLEFPAPERSTIEVATVYVPEVQSPQIANLWKWIGRMTWASIAVLILIAFVPLAKADRDWIAPGPPVTRIFKSLDGKFHLATVTRAQPNHPYVEVVMERDITAADVESELAKLR